GIEWEASNVSARGSFLVSIDLQLGGLVPDITNHCMDTVRALSEGSRSRQDISHNISPFDRDDPLESVFQIVVNNLGINHSYSVVELETGEGLGYSAKRRVVYEIGPSSDAG